MSRAMLRSSQSMSTALVGRDASDMEAITGLDEDQIRDEVMTLSAIEPKNYQQFRNVAKYGVDGNSDAGANGKVGNFIVPRANSIKTTLSTAYHRSGYSLNLFNKPSDLVAGDNKDVATYNKSALRAFMLPYEIISELPKSIKQEMLNNAYEQAKNTAMASFDQYFPASFQKKAVDENTGMSLKGLTSL